jgi:cytochrome c biogenesis protein CcmG/thiol:disulfide interchange protein DsbE
VNVMEKKPAETNLVDNDAGAWRRRMIVFIPLIAFLVLAALFVLRLGAGDPSRIPSALIGHPAPRTDLPPLAGLEREGKPVPGLDRTKRPC